MAPFVEFYWRRLCESSTRVVIVPLRPFQPTRWKKNTKNPLVFCFAAPTMVKQVIADAKAVEGYAATLRAAGTAFQTGLLVGSIEDDAVLIAHLAPTPLPNTSAGAHSIFLAILQSQKHRSHL